MIEINFFEDREQNLLPAIYTIIFLIGILLIGAYIGGSGLYYYLGDRQNTTQLEEINEQAFQTRQRERVLNLVNQTENNLEQIEANRYPSVSLYDFIHEVFDNPEEDVIVYRFNELEQLHIEIEVDNLQVIADYYDELLEVPFVSQVELTTTYEQDQSYVGEYELTIDEEALREERDGE